MELLFGLFLLFCAILPCNCEVIRVNRELKVPFGRTVFLDPVLDLSIEVEPHDRCTVVVLQNDPLAQKPGFLLPQSFPCSFPTNLVHYTHLGSRSPADDRVPLQIRYDSARTTEVLPFTLQIKIDFLPLTIVKTNLPITVKRLGGLSTPIDSSILEFNYDANRWKCEVSILNAEATGLPRYGMVDAASENQISIGCEKFLKSNLRYRHFAQLRKPPDKDYIPLVVKVSDENDRIDTEHFRISVVIAKGQENTAPYPSVHALLMMEVSQSVMTPITPLILAAADKESENSDLILRLVRNPGPSHGTLISTDDHKLVLNSFYQSDVQNLKIAYIPPSIEGEEQKIFQLEFEAVDTEGLSSDPFTLMIAVRPVEEKAPVVVKNAGIQLFEGESRPILTSTNLEVSDEDGLSKVRISVVDGLRHGEMKVLGHSTQFFTPKDLDSGNVVYQHDGSDSFSDNIIFLMTDGQHTVEFLFPISIHPRDDEPPVVSVNTGFTIYTGDIMEVTPFILSATDADSDDENIRFYLIPPYSRDGSIVLQHETKTEGEQWQQYQGKWIREVTEWTQKDITDGRLFYQHLGTNRVTIAMDRVSFRVSDNNVPPNESRDERLLVKVLPIDEQAPMRSGVPLKMTVQEFQTTKFSTDVLRYTDYETEDRNIVYIITKGPYDKRGKRDSLDVGELVKTNAPDQTISRFTQSEVHRGKISYKPPEVELGITPREIRFNFDVQDSNSNTLPNQTFLIILEPVNNAVPQVVNTGASVVENAFLRLTPAMLDISDPDTDSSAIVLTITELPKHGQLKSLGNLMAVGDNFILNDIHMGHIVYVNTGLEMTEDSFGIDVSDGRHHVPVKFQIEITNIDDEAPILNLPPGTLGSRLEVLERMSSLITARVLKATDVDTDDSSLTFIIDHPPRKGIIKVRGQQSLKFTQLDIMHGHVEYQHTGGEIGLTTQMDEFNLTLSDGSDEWIVGGNRVYDVNVHVTIKPVDSIAPEVIIGSAFLVTEGAKRALTLPYLTATDKDTSYEKIVCVLTKPPEYGFLENVSPPPGSDISREGRAISAFTIGDVENNVINYVQSIHRGLEPVEDKFTIGCNDGVNHSPEHTLPLIIEPSNDEPPEIFTREFVVMEGGSLVIDLPILNVLDKDVPADSLEITVTDRPKHGDIVRQNGPSAVSVRRFSMNDITMLSTIVYTHDNTETSRDYFTIKASDGRHSSSKVVEVVVLPVDDETPRMVVNNGLEVGFTDVKVVTTSNLRASDLDSDDTKLTFVLRQTPHFGALQLRHSNGYVQNLTVGMNFTQWQINDGMLQFQHKKRGGYRDLIKFDVTDGLNTVIDRYFYISLGGFDLVSATVVNKGVLLPESGSVTITTELLTSTDLNTPADNIVYKLLRTPDKGHLESLNKPSVTVTTFSHKDLSSNKITYLHTGDDNVRMDSLEFEVSDGQKNIYQTIRICLSAENAKLPILMYNGMRVKEGGVRLITSFELKAVDQDSSDWDIQFRIIRAPVHGRIIRDGAPGIIYFTQNDIKNNMIRYDHDGTETTEDSFLFVVTDGRHEDFYVYPNTVYTIRRPQILNIEVVPVDNSVPRIVNNRGAPSLAQLEDTDIYTFTNRALEVKDRDSPNSHLMFVVTGKPNHGHIVHTAFANMTVTNWTQGAIDALQVRYVLHPGVNVTQDMFTFNVVDPAGNTLTNQQFHLRWAYVSFEKSTYVVNETDKYLEVRLKRRGSLQETAFVTITAIDGSATSSMDFYSRYTKQVQFNPGQTDRVWRLRMIDDNKFENGEQFTIKLSQPDRTLIEKPDEASVTILDLEDESTVYFSDRRYEIQEDQGNVLIPVHRTGDLSKEFMVICHTEQGSANGTFPKTVTSFSDYITRPNDQTSFVRFDRFESEKSCMVKVIDDTMYEDSESFDLILSSPVGGRIGDFKRITVVIQPDVKDEPLVFFNESVYIIDESEGMVEAAVMRAGSDLQQTASVVVRSRRSEPISAESDIDYVAIHKTLTFEPGVMLQKVQITILDDTIRPVIENEETFELVLRRPTRCAMGEPSVAVIKIVDSVSDLPTFQFLDGQYRTSENQPRVSVMVTRRGDARLSASVVCFTRPDTATVTSDFIERVNASSSTIVFLPGEVMKPCSINLVGDRVYEGEESFRVVLGTPESDAPGGARIGTINETEVIIADEEDKPDIGFQVQRLNIKEPKKGGKPKILNVSVMRSGDLSQTSIVSLYTRDSSARSGVDYNGQAKALVFSAGISNITVPIEILPSDSRQTTQSFFVHLRPDQNRIADIRVSRMKVNIEVINTMAHVMFPSTPIVISLKSYDTPDKAASSPMPGYPVVCITACNPRHPDYASKTRIICHQESINDSMTEYTWKVAAPSVNGITNELIDVDRDTFFTKTNNIALDSIYFGPGSRVQCGVRAGNREGRSGLQAFSKAVTIGAVGPCQSRAPGTFGAEPFTARMRYTGPFDSAHPNKMHLSLSIPHQDGMLPILSTHMLSNFDLTLSPSAFRLGIHKCSNLLDFDEVRTEIGFLTEGTKSLLQKEEFEPYQFSDVRSRGTLRFYKNLNLETCQWQFESYYSMSELVVDCGGRINTNGLVLNEVQSYVSVTVPLYVSYVYHSLNAPGGWLHSNLNTDLHVSFVYDTAILWQDGISTLEPNTFRGKDEALKSPSANRKQGHLYPTSMHIGEDGGLVVNFKTKGLFRGQFVVSHPRTTVMSTVHCPERSFLTFTLELLHSDKTFEKPEQHWRFVSDYAIRDYSGSYKIQLLPCLTQVNQTYRSPIECVPQSPAIFNLRIRLQQVTDPVAANYSLNTQFYLLKSNREWLQETGSYQPVTDTVYEPGDTIYAKLMVAPVQSLGDQFELSVERVYLCSGKEGYIPNFNPRQGEFGCVENSPKLEHRFKVLDKSAANSVDRTFKSIPFNARLARGIPDAKALFTQPGTDGFTLDSRPLFEVETARLWFLHSIFTIRGRNGRVRRRVHSISSPDLANIGQDGKGTNLARISLNYTAKSIIAEMEASVNPHERPDNGPSLLPIMYGIIAAIVVLTVAIAVTLIVMRRKHSAIARAQRQAAQEALTAPPPAPAPLSAPGPPLPPPRNNSCPSSPGTVTVMTRNGGTRLIHTLYMDGPTTDI